MKHVLCSNGRWIDGKGPSIKYNTSRNFWPILTPLPSVTLCHTSREPPESTSHISDPPIFSRPGKKNPGQKSPVQILSQLFAEVFVWGFCPGWFLSVPLLSQYICYNRKLNITLNFMFHMYNKNLCKR